MDFFEHQDRARRGTLRLIVMFALAVAGTTALVYALVLAVFYLGTGYVETNTGYDEFSRRGVTWLEMLGWTFAGVGGTIGLGSVFKIVSLRSGGGESVALSLGGMPIDPDTTDPDERKVLNVVEEMAIASGLPVPPVYLLSNETGINAFAAGYKPEAAVVGVTRGCVEQLSRDELQGVVAHEFAHILNGDMRLNIRLIGVVFGILALTVIGRLIVRGAFFSTSSRSREGGGGKLAMLLIGVALIVIGYVGVLFGKLIQAAVSRQREYLADASAVQFTRNPDGLAGALKRIGGHVYGGEVDSPHAEETAHLFFAKALSSLGGAFATHPPLPDRIRRLDPHWDGAYPEPNAVMAASAAEGGVAIGGAMGLAGASPSGASSTSADSNGTADRVLASVGRLDQAHIEHARKLLKALPAEVAAAAHRPVEAQALVYALLFDARPEVQKAQLDTLAKHAPVAAARSAAQLANIVLAMDRSLKLPALDLAVPSLARMAQPDYRKFVRVVEALIAADDRVDLFEWALRRVIARHVGARFERDAADRVKHHRIEPLKDEVSSVLAMLARVGHGRDEQAAAAAWRGAVRDLPALAAQAEGGLPQVDLRAVSDALDELATLTPALKRDVVRACVRCVSVDDEVTGNEAELLRVVVEAMGVPIPPILPGPMPSDA